jgi:sugar transferase (PEP-CTERM/EpsH1 system associated)
VSSAKKNILFLTHRAPYPPNRGDRIRSYQMLRYLAERYRVYLGALVEQPVPEEDADVLKQLTVERALVPLGRYRRWLHAAAYVASGRAATEGLFASRRLHRQVRAWAEAVDFHAVIAFCSSMVQFTAVPELQGVPLLVDLVDVDSQKWMDYAVNSRGWKRWLLKVEAARVRRLECSLPGRASAITLVSQVEADLYRGFCPNDKTYAVPNGVDLDYFRPDSGARGSRPNQCVFVGVLDYRPNVEGLVWFARQVWPLIRAARPEAVLAIVGKNPAQAVRALAARPGIRLVGEVADVRPYLAESRFAIAPLQIARGVQNKVLEAMAMGLPVLATPQALEGLRTQAGIQALSATAARDFADWAVRLFGDERLCRRLGEEGREYVEQHHCWSRCLAPLGEILAAPCLPAAKPARRERANLVPDYPLAEQTSV